MIASLELAHSPHPIRVGLHLQSPPTPRLRTECQQLKTKDTPVAETVNYLR